MKQFTHILIRHTQGRGIYDLTAEIKQWAENFRLNTGLLTLYIQHTSASLLINENYDSDVTADLERFFDRLVPDGDPLFVHTAEGKDDMPAHARTALTGVNLAIPLIESKVALGTWQGIFLFEHRHMPAKRRVVMHLLGE